MNIFYLLAGAAAASTAVMHAMWAEKRIIKDLKQSNMTDLAKAGFSIAWHQITALLAVSGVFLIMLSFLNVSETIETAGILIAVIFTGNIIVFFTVSKLRYPHVFKSTLYPVINSGAIILLIILGFLV
ncbi:hypothetical protein [Salipaludibacillus aurantiacus]|uniref:DUF1761 domain-containing protein n=1 Tax=Salipaludibacillus aurantiacus TaxID=1601833 RepID=A0A1H9V1C8_9BACI|nr:hypothetical protein [Salipaludibacillus aurantiacus]SES15486.1 hypothetical protein SAMN05518684_10974 [Salipaludibacillus aurantiacus]